MLFYRIISRSKYGSQLTALVLTLLKEIPKISILKCYFYRYILYCYCDMLLLVHLIGTEPLHWKQVHHFERKHHFIGNSIKANPLHRKNRLHINDIHTYNQPN